MLPDILSVISLCLLHETPCNAFLLNICAICSNITELGSLKDSKPWNGIFFQTTGRSRFTVAPFLKNLVEIEIVQIAHKIPI